MPLNPLVFQKSQKYSTPVTPARRLIDHPDVPQATKDRLSAQAKTLNPFHLQKQIQRKLKAIFKLVR